MKLNLNPKSVNDNDGKAVVLVMVLTLPVKIPVPLLESTLFSIMVTEGALAGGVGVHNTPEF